MRTTFFVFIAAFFVGCATTPDPIDNLVIELSASHGMWDEGGFPILNLPQSATPDDVIKKRFNMGLAQGEVAHYKILKMRKVHIPINELGSDICTAVIIRKDSDEKIVLLKYCGPAIGWWSRVYDIKP